MFHWTATAECQQFSVRGIFGGFGGQMVHMEPQAGAQCGIQPAICPNAVEVFAQVPDLAPCSICPFLVHLCLLSFSPVWVFFLRLCTDIELQECCLIFLVL